MKVYPKCKTCGGSGRKEFPLFYADGTWRGCYGNEPCPRCKGTGVEPDCQKQPRVTCGSCSHFIKQLKKGGG